MKLLLPTSMDDDPALPAKIEVVRYDPHRPVPPEHLDAEALVAWDNAPGVLSTAAQQMPRLRWVQSLAAGPDDVLAAGFGADVVLTSGLGLHDSTVAEHALALVLALIRRLPACLDAQARQRWDPALGGAQPLYPDGPVTTLLDSRVLIWGFGGIGGNLASLLSTLGASVRGAARTTGQREGYDVVGPDGLLEALAETDVLVMVLPGGDATRGALSAEQLAALPRHAYVVNVGRGTTVDEDALVQALESGSIAGAALDVATTEPLPASSPLWRAPRVLITPHAAGGRPVG
ncbi:MAG: phosphoglycerate dehydrogenase, partial [Micrococcales bacterium]